MPGLIHYILATLDPGHSGFKPLPRERQIVRIENRIKRYERMRLGIDVEIRVARLMLEKLKAEREPTPPTNAA